MHGASAEREPEELIAVSSKPLLDGSVSTDVATSYVVVRPYESSVRAGRLVSGG